MDERQTTIDILKKLPSDRFIPTVVPLFIILHAIHKKTIYIADKSKTPKNENAAVIKKETDKNVNSIFNECLESKFKFDSG